MNANITIFNALDQLTFTKFSNKLRINHWKLYKTNTNINKQFTVLSVYVLSAFNAHINEINVKKSFDADWMLVRLKKKIVIILLIKLIFVQIVKN